MDFSKLSRIVIKIGSALLVDSDTHEIRSDWLQAVAADIATWRKNGQEVIVVSSGAVAVGRTILGLGARKLKLEEKQAAAAAGQIRLAHAYQNVMAGHGINVAQILLTLHDSENRRRYLNARATMETLLKLDTIPLINENDTVATEEIRFGDNDRLAARVAQMLKADGLVLLSDIDGLYTADPKTDANATLVPKVTELTDNIRNMAGREQQGFGTGGMVTKLMAAEIAMGAGCAMAIAYGHTSHALDKLAKGGRATWFVPSSTPRTARKRWIAGSLKPKGKLVIDEGAVKALTAGKSLLPAGVCAVHGTFLRGDGVNIENTTGRKLGKGLSAYCSEDASRIAGHHSTEIEKILGFRGRDEIIHRDDLALDSE